MFSVYTIQYRYPTPPHDRDSSAHPNVSIWRLELYPDRRAIVVATLFVWLSFSFTLLKERAVLELDIHMFV